MGRVGSFCKDAVRTEAHAGLMLGIARLSPGTGYEYLTGQVASGRHDFRPTGQSSGTAYYADVQARGEAPGWWAGTGAGLLGVSGEVTQRRRHRAATPGRVGGGPRQAARRRDARAAAADLAAHHDPAATPRRVGVRRDRQPGQVGQPAV